MKTKMTKVLLVMIGSVGLLAAGCSTTSNQGAMGNETQYGGGSGSGPAQVATGANGSISPSNPFGINSGIGLTPAR